jgi:putative Mn2+ efflux pump MntP
MPWIALILLGLIGGKMLYEGIKNKDCQCECGCASLTLGVLLVQGIATSIDALSAGLNFVEYNLWGALVAAVVIALVTFMICMCGVFLGKKTGTKLAGKAGILGGAILIAIGIWIFVKGFFGI